MDATAHSLLRHDPPTRRHTVSEPEQRANQTAPATSHTGHPSIPVAQGGIVTTDYGGLSISKASPLTLGPMASRRASLTHVSRQGVLPQSHLSAFYPDFLRRRITTARHEVVAEETDKELLTESPLAETTGGLLPWNPMDLPRRSANS